MYVCNHGITILSDTYMTLNKRNKKSFLQKIDSTDYTYENGYMSGLVKED